MIFSTLRTVIGFVLAGSMMFSGTAPVPAGAQALQTVHVGVIDAMTMSPVFVGAAKGYFRDEGLDVDFVSFDSATTMVVPLAQGRIDVGAGALSASFYNSVARGLDVRIVAALGNDPKGYGFEQLLVRTDLVKSGRYKSPKDLKGMRIAMNTLGAMSTTAMDRLLRSAGLTLADITHVTLPFTEHALAFQNGSIDASVMAEPLASVTVNTGAATRVLNADSWYPDQQIAALFYGSSFLRTHRDTGVKFMRAYLRALTYYDRSLRGGKIAGAHADEVVAILAKSSMIHDPAVIRALTPSSADPNGKLNLDSMRSDLKFFRDQGLIEGNVDIDGAIDMQFLADAQKR